MRRSLAILAAAAMLLLAAAPVAAAKPEIEASYANGQEVAMIGPHLTTTPSHGLYAHSEELYLTAYDPASGTIGSGGELTLPSGVQPLCNPCYHPGLPEAFVYHDHVLSGAPGYGNHGTAGVFTGPWKIIVMMYNPAKTSSPDFVPFKSQAGVEWGEDNGYFLQINEGAANPYEIDTGWVLICPVTSWNA